MFSIEIYDLWLANFTNRDWIIVPHKPGAIKQEKVVLLY